MTQRRAGILLHPTSLPGSFGIGDLGPGAKRFLEWSAEAGAMVWQTLPLNSTGLGNSPYTPASAFAGNPLLISPRGLLDDGLLDPSDLESPPQAAADRVDFGAVEPWKENLLRTAWNRFSQAGAAARLAEELHRFRAAPEQESWLDDWVLFAAIKAERGGAGWTAWPEDLRDRHPEALEHARQRLSDELAYRRFVQFLFFRQWEGVRSKARDLGIEILGDLPIYVALDSADVWSHRDLFDLDERGEPRTVAGVPPDYFSPTGQRWGNPIYRWERLRETGYAWWIDRMRSNFRLADRVRIDHFRGLASFWRVDAAEETAASGEWSPGPGLELFDALRAALGDLPLVAEDLGEITPDVEQLRRELGVPGMRVLQFGFDEVGSLHAPHRLPADSVVYTGTHDNDTTRGWFDTAAPETRRRTLDYLGGDAEEIAWTLVRAAWGAPAELAIAPLQDLIGLGPEARMNIPGESAGNWDWRLPHFDLLGAGLSARLRRLAEVTERLAPPPADEASTAQPEQG